MGDIIAKNHVGSVLCEQTSLGDPLIEMLRSYLWNGNYNIPIGGIHITENTKTALIFGIGDFLAQRGPIDACGELREQMGKLVFCLNKAGNARIQSMPEEPNMIVPLALAVRQARQYFKENETPK